MMILAITGCGCVECTPSQLHQQCSYEQLQHGTSAAPTPKAAACIYIEQYEARFQGHLAALL
jgi:hypothetical protein